MFKKKNFNSSQPFKNKNGLNYPMTNSITVNNQNYTQNTKAQISTGNKQKLIQNIKLTSSKEVQYKKISIYDKQNTSLVNKNQTSNVDKTSNNKQNKPAALRDNFLLSNSNITVNKKNSSSKNYNSYKNSSKKDSTQGQSQTQGLTFSFNPIISQKFQKIANKLSSNKKSNHQISRQTTEQQQSQLNRSRNKTILSNTNKSTNINYLSSLNSFQFKISKAQYKGNSNSKQKSLKKVNLSSNKKFESTKLFNTSQSKLQLKKQTSNNNGFDKSNKSLQKSNFLFQNNTSNSNSVQNLFTKNLFYNQKDSRSQKSQNCSRQLYSKKSTLQSTQKQVNSSHTCQQSIKVFIRFKPINQSTNLSNSLSLQNSQSKTLINESQIRLLNDQVILAQNKVYAFDKLFKEQRQIEIFQQIGKPIIDKIFQGFNGTIFAYGQTGSGKTHTIFGNINNSQYFGLIPHSIRQILNKKQSFEQENQQESVNITCTLVQIYKEQLFDMFNFSQIQQTNKKPQLKLKQSKEKGVYIDNLTQIQVQNQQQILFVVQEALKNRRISATKLNQKSSRSHTILTLNLHFSNFSTSLSLIDLAGSQKVNKSGVTGQSLEQTKKINYSLSCLGNVINALTTRSNTDHIPFRDSKLTRILKNSLSGNFLTSIIVTCSLSNNSYNETISSLKFAQRAKRVKILPQNQIDLQRLNNKAESQENTSRMADSLQYYQSKINQLAQQLLMTKKQLNIYKMRQSQSHSLRDQNSIDQNQKLIGQQLAHQTQIPTIRNEPVGQINVNSYYQGQDLTARLPIPSERACVAQKITKYSQKQIVPLYLGSKRQSVHFWDGLSGGQEKNNNKEIIINKSNMIQSYQLNAQSESQNEQSNDQIDFTQLSEQQTLRITQTRRYLQKQKRKSIIINEEKQSQISFSFSIYKQQDQISERRNQSTNNKFIKRTVR